ncbi:MAG TPA: hypothetical protein VMK12_04345 [Anaeromyxobacteraceae bacterium]|nr:hypothetical protein [Anaeromyxobacteraceae bacterium]
MHDETVDSGTKQDRVARAPWLSVNGAVTVGSDATSALDRRIERAWRSIWTGLKRFPYVGVLLAAGVGLAAATVIGAEELVIGIAAGYGAYQILKKNVPASEAFKEARKVEEDMG